jgi:hypothetical protein
MLEIMRKKLGKYSLKLYVPSVDVTAMMKLNLVWFQGIDVIIK